MAYKLSNVSGDSRPRTKKKSEYGNLKNDWINVSTLWNGAVNVNEERLSG